MTLYRSAFDGYERSEIAPRKSEIWPFQRPMKLAQTECERKREEELEDDFIQLVQERAKGVEYGGSPKSGHSSGW